MPPFNLHPAPPQNLLLGVPEIWDPRLSSQASSIQVVDVYSAILAACEEEGEERVRFEAPVGAKLVSEHKEEFESR